MQNFKSFLLKEDIHINFAPWHLRNRIEIEDAINADQSNNIGEFNILKGGSVDVMGVNTIFEWHPKNDFNDEQLPFHFNKADSLTIVGYNLTNIWGAPTSALDLTLKCQKLKSLEHLEGRYADLELNCHDLEEFKCKVNASFVSINDCKIFNAKDFSKCFYSDDSLYLNFGNHIAEHVIVDTPLLSLLNAKNFKRISYTGISANVKMHDLALTMSILTKHAKFGADILDCQEELITNGLRQYAKL
jgi:hypothetical protein